MYGVNGEAVLEAKQAVVEGGLFLLFEGGQFIWPGVEVGFTRRVRVYDKDVTMTTLELRPLIFEINNFLSAEEQEALIAQAEDNHRRSETAKLADARSEKGGTEKEKEKKKAKTSKKENGKGKSTKATGGDADMPESAGKDKEAAKDRDTTSKLGASQSCIVETKNDAMCANPPRISMLAACFVLRAACCVLREVGRVGLGDATVLLALSRPLVSGILSTSGPQTLPGPI